MSSINVNAMHSNIAASSKAARVTESQTSFAATLTSTAETAGKSQAVRNSVVDDYKRAHPDETGSVERKVSLGKNLLEQNGYENIDRDAMSMDEYKALMTDLIDSVPFHYTRPYDKELTNISEAGWEQMKNDPDYEAWILGYTVENRSVQNPFFASMGASADYYTENFGATIEEHLGESIPMNTSLSGSSVSKRSESWWEKRHDEDKALLEARTEKRLEKAQAERAALLQAAIEKTLQQRELTQNVAAHAENIAALYENAIL